MCGKIILLRVCDCFEAASIKKVTLANVYALSPQDVVRSCYVEPVQLTQ